jgi:HJR/Mrr/RecB family endonuclease
MSRRQRSRETSPEERLGGLAFATVLTAIAWFLWLPKDTNPLFVVSVLVGLAAVWWQAIRNVRAIRRSYATRQQLATLTPTEFEQWCAHRLRALGYAVRHVGGQGDHGIDLFAEKDGERVVVQCKRFTGSRTVGEPQLRDIFGAMHAEGAVRAIVITAGYFTEEARAWARGKPIELWDANRVVVAPSPGSSAAGGATPFPIAKINAAEVRCKQCGSDLVIRKNRSTKQTFYGCSRYPSCRFTRPMEVQPSGAT